MGTTAPWRLTAFPAHLVERVEIVRSASPDGDAQGIGGTINIVLLDKHEGGLDLVASGMQFDNNDKQRGQSAANYGMTRGNFSFFGYRLRFKNGTTPRTSIPTLSIAKAI